MCRSTIPAIRAWLAAGNEVIVLASEADLNQVLNDVGLGHRAADLTTPSRNYKVFGEEKVLNSPNK